MMMEVRKKLLMIISVVMNVSLYLKINQKLIIYLSDYLSDLF